MASQHQPTEVFRFLHVRNPSIITILNETQFIIYNWPPGTENLYTTLVEIKNANEEDWKDQILAEVVNFKASDMGFKNLFQVHKVFSDFSEITEYLNYNDLGGATLTDWMASEYSIDVHAFLTSNKEDIDRLWNNLFAQSIIPDNNGVLSALVLCLRIVNLIGLADRAHEATGTIEGIRGILKALAALPDELFPIEILPEPVDIEDPPAEDNEVELYKKIKSGIKQLENWYNRQLNILGREMNRIFSHEIDPDDPEFVEYLASYAEAIALIKALDIYDREYAADIGTEFTEALEAIGGDFTGLSKNEIKKILEEKASQIFVKNASKVQPGYNVTIIGKTLYVETAANCADCCNPSDYFERLRMGPIGMGDFYKVEQQLHCYKPAEIAHVENVMIGETRNRVTRRLDRFEEITVTETETITETEKDTQSTTRSEQEVNSETVMEKNQSLSAGLNLSGSYGTVHFNSSFSIGTSSSLSTSIENASKYSREVVERARQLEIKRMRTETTIKILHEFEETNTHGFENTTEINQVGVYRWLDKFYFNRLINYGPHLMFEFIIPEPAFFHLYAKTINTNQTTKPKLVKPIAPNDAAYWTTIPIPLWTHHDVDPTNFTFWGAYYNISLDPYPESEKVISQGMATTGSAPIMDSSNSLIVPDGYEAYLVGASLDKWGGTDAIVVHIGGSNIAFIPGVPIWSTFLSPASGLMVNQTGSIGVAILATEHLVATFYIKCRLKQETIEAWQAKNFQTIWGAYYTKLREYEDALREQQQLLSFSPSYASTNPAFNRDIEKMELKKNCLEMLMEPRFKDTQDAINCQDKVCTQPELNKYFVRQNSTAIKFFETAFEWDQMTYEFYEYFWGRKCKWVKLYNLEDSDPLFQKFLQAGAARVVIPVRRGREASVMYYVESGTMTEDNTITLAVPEYVAANAELITDPDPVEIDNWITKMPTNLVALQCVSGCIDEEGLPCYDTSVLEEEPPVHE